MNEKTLLAIFLAVAVAGCSDKSPEYQPAAGTLGNATAPAAPTVAVDAPRITEFTGDLGSTPTSDLCALDAVNDENAANGVFAAAAAAPIVFEGWVATSSLTTPGSLTLVLSSADTAIAASGNTGVARQDVADAYGSPALANAGFRLELPASQVPAGDYSVAVLHDEAGSPLACTNLSRLVVS